MSVLQNPSLRNSKNKWFVEILQEADFPFLYMESKAPVLYLNVLLII